MTEQCKRGHTLTPSSVYVTKVGYRACKQCHAERSLAHYHATKKLKTPGYRHTKDAYWPDVVDYIPGWGAVFKEKLHYQYPRTPQTPKALPPKPALPAWRPVFVLLNPED